LNKRDQGVLDFHEGLRPLGRLREEIVAIDVVADVANQFTGAKHKRSEFIAIGNLVANFATIAKIEQSVEIFFFVVWVFGFHFSAII
jgi:hypothetical protein